MPLSSEVYDVAIVGGGPGGYVAAIRAAQLGLKTLLIEKDKALGGTCLHRGCIPTKTWLHDSDFYHKVLHCEKYGIKLSAPPQLDIVQLLKRKNEVIRRMAMGLDGLMKKNRVEVATGWGRLLSPTRLQVDERVVEARHLVLATGSAPSLLPGLQVDSRRVFTSDEILELDSVPTSIVILGAGAVGMEFASIYNRLGSKVVVLEMMDRALPMEDAEISAEIARSYQRQGIEVLTSTRMQKVEVQEHGVRVQVSGSAGERWLEAEILLSAAGRKPLLEGIGVEELGLSKAGRYLQVDGLMRTSISNIYAIGDIVPSAQLAHVASAEGIVAVEHIAGHTTRPLDYHKIPSATYCHPEVASVGLTEQQAIEKGYAVRVGRFPWAALGKAQMMGETEGLVKVVAEEKYGELLGVHMVGPLATELIHEACVALNCEATVEELFRTVHAHPTLSEGVMEAAHGVFSNPIHYIPPPVRKPAAR
ncbi:dihydrolipoyl dehydrogenase [bacterium]|nr:dihydrolipoyl dehydrogenase [bacterium]